MASYCVTNKINFHSDVMPRPEQNTADGKYPKFCRTEAFAFQAPTDLLNHSNNKDLEIGLSFVWG